MENKFSLCLLKEKTFFKYENDSLLVDENEVLKLCDLIPVNSFSIEGSGLNIAPFVVICEYIFLFEEKMIKISLDKKEFSSLFKFI